MFNGLDWYARNIDKIYESGKSSKYVSNIFFLNDTMCGMRDVEWVYLSAKTR